MRTVRFLFPCLLLLTLPVIVSAQSCCQIRKNDGQAAYDKGDYEKAIFEWSKGKDDCSDSLKCPELDQLIRQAKARIKPKTDEAKPKKSQATQRKNAGKKPPSKKKHLPPAAEARAKIAPPKPKPAPDKFIRITGGTFPMGDLFDEGASDEKPVRNVTLSDYYLSPYEVTFDEYDAFCAATGRTYPSDENWGRKQKPVINVSWNDAIAYCNWLSEQRDLQKVYAINGAEVSANWKANGYRLPTEAEWEYAAREGGKKVRFGNGQNIADPQAINFNGGEDYKQPYSTAGEYRSKTVPVGSLNSPNALGLHDMSGNVWEWCWDWYGTYPAGSETNPKGPLSGSYRVDRGGSWYFFPARVRCAIRSSLTPGVRVFSLGFRLARAVR